MIKLGPRPAKIAFAGFARSGKNVLADAFIEHGFVRRDMSDAIKEFFAPYLKNEISRLELEQRIMLANHQRQSGVTSTALVAFYDHVIAVDEARRGRAIDAFTEDNADKQIIRPIFEHGGDLLYRYFLMEHMRRVDAAYSAGKDVVTTRLVRPEEAQEWRRRGGVIVRVEREDWKPASEWEAHCLEALEPYIDHTIHNAESSGPAWELAAHYLAKMLLGPRPRPPHPSYLSL